MSLARSGPHPARPSLVDLNRLCITAKTGAEREKAILDHADQTRSDVTRTMVEELRPTWLGLGIAPPLMQVRYTSVQWKDLHMLGGDLYEVTATAEFAALPDLLTRLPVVKEGDRAYLVVANDRDESPQVQNGKLKAYIDPVERSLDAYPRYLELFEGGLDIAVHVGDDYNDPRLDIAHARSLYAHLLSRRFVSPVSRFEDLAIDSAPLTRTIRVKDEDVPVRVRIVHKLMTTEDTHEKLIDAFVNSAKTADVVIYDGHAAKGPAARIALSLRDAEIWVSTLAKLDLTDKQQIYFFNGCTTYSVYEDALYANPRRNPHNTDVISALGKVTMYHAARPVMAFIDALLGISEGWLVPSDGPWIPNSWTNILSRLGDGDWDDAYGVHGSDDNPKLSPLADASVFGLPCRADADCGGTDSKCVQSRSGTVCGLACADSAGCPGSAVCAFNTGQCVK